MTKPNLFAPCRLWLVILLWCLPLSQLAAQTPRFVIYYNSDASPLSALIDLPYTHVIIAFLEPVPSVAGEVRLALPPRMAPFWNDIPRLQANGKRVLISFGGGRVDAKRYAPLVGRESALAEELASFVRDYGLDGIDIDFEASPMLYEQPPAGVADGRRFLMQLTRALRQRLPSPRYEITHAPQPPYLDPDWHGGPYLSILGEVGDAVNWITVQYYNNPGFDGPTASRVVGTGAAPFITSYRGLMHAAHGLNWPSDKLVVGKPVYHADAGSGHISPQDLISQVIQPLGTEFGTNFGGIAGWQFSTHTADHKAWNASIGPLLLEFRKHHPVGAAPGR